MKSNAATTIESMEFEYNQELHRRVVSVIKTLGNSIDGIASLMHVNSKDLADYLERRPIGRILKMALNVPCVGGLKVIPGGG